ncbi:alpha/beta fold hydrolase [Sphingomonas sp.]|jgi:pimeloyl-ACP methyl ester carboxylesterase|uniref:alpha/beta fold hydrolase n=1 Tax=Sphingomonas sp. TaxID=28214 RepID=UPI0035C79360
MRQVGQWATGARRAVAKAWVAFFLLAAVAPAVPAATPEPIRNVVLVHGALSDGSQWREVYDRLVRDGYHVSVVQHPLRSLNDDVATTRRIIAQQDGPVVLVGHSYGGAVISMAGVDPKVKALVYVAAFQPDQGESMTALMARMPAPQWELKPLGDGQGMLDRADFANVYAQDLPVDRTDFLAASQVPIATAIFTTALGPVAWHDKPSYGIVATQDHGISPDLQRWMYRRAKAHVVEVESSHAVMMSHPEVVVAEIEQAATGR